MKTFNYHTAKDVKEAIIEILALENEKMDSKDAIKYVETMQENGRYLQDIWSSIISKPKLKLKTLKSKSKDERSDSADNNDNTCDGIDS